VVNYCNLQSILPVHVKKEEEVICCTAGAWHITQVNYTLDFPTIPQPSRPHSLQCSVLYGIQQFSHQAPTTPTSDRGKCRLGRAASGPAPRFWPLVVSRKPSISQLRISAPSPAPRFAKTSKEPLADPILPRTGRIRNLRGPGSALQSERLQSGLMPGHRLQPVSRFAPYFSSLFILFYFIYFYRSSLWSVDDLRGYWAAVVGDIMACPCKTQRRPPLAY
jgi:hypothetical protein